MSFFALRGEKRHTQDEKSTLYESPKIETGYGVVVVAVGTTDGADVSTN